MFIPDPNFYSPGSRLPDPGSKIFPDPGSKILPDPGSGSKNLSNLTHKMFLSSRKYDPKCSSRIRILIYLPIPDPDPQYCISHYYQLLHALSLPNLFMGWPSSRVRSCGSWCIAYATSRTGTRYSRLRWVSSRWAAAGTASNPTIFSPSASPYSTASVFLE